MVTANMVRHLALALPGTAEGAHMGHTDFRRGKRIFATIDYPRAGYAMVKLTPAQQSILTEAEPDIFTPVSGGWGTKGATLIRLDDADMPTVQSALEMAWTNLATKR